MYINENILNSINSPVRTIKAKVEHYRGSTLVNTFFYNDYIKSIKVERLGDESKFFGFGICQKANVKLRDTNRDLSFTTSDHLIISLGAGEEYINPFSYFYITEVHRDENTNSLSITAYDSIAKAAEHTVSELTLERTTTNEEFLNQCALLLGCEGVGGSLHHTAHWAAELGGVNVEGTENIRFILDAFAEKTQIIYYIQDNILMVKALKPTDTPVLTIDKSSYKNLKNGDNRRLSTICHATELGDNVSATTGVSGSTQYVRNNPFWELREDIANLLQNALARVGDITISQFDCKWRGNFLLEIGDKIELITKDNQSITSYVLNDAIEYNGALSQHTQWNYVESAETAANPSTLGEVLNQTSAKVDKVNKEIELLASTANEHTEAIASITLKTDEITSTVQRVEMETQASIENLNTITTELTTQIQQASDNIQISIDELKNSGVDHVTTSTGFTFDKQGLTISKSDSEIKTKITEDGMTVYKNNTAVLTADATGVNAVDLKASTYLVIGKNSRFEDMGSNRTACFWIGN